MLKLSENPPMLSPGVGSLCDLLGTWWVAHTKARCEKAFALDLQDREIGFFLPMLERVRIISGKKRRVLLPLFPSYVFFCGDREQRQRALLTDRLCATIEVRDQQRLIDELSSIQRLLDAKVDVEPHPQLATGQRCRIKEGPFAGMEGKVLHHSRPARFVLEVGMLGQGASMEIDAELLEPACS
jgi:transcription antitermination factor NusG